MVKKHQLHHLSNFRWTQCRWHIAIKIALIFGGFNVFDLRLHCAVCGYLHCDDDVTENRRKWQRGKKKSNAASDKRQVAVPYWSEYLDSSNKL